jgi:hypothetical protein
MPRLDREAAVVKPPPIGIGKTYRYKVLVRTLKPILPRSTFHMKTRSKNNRDKWNWST